VSISSTDPDFVSPSIEKHFIRRFSRLVSDLEGGGLDTDASNALEEITMLANEAIQQDRKMKATMTITIDFVAHKGVVEVNSNLKTKLPAPVRRTSMMHVAAGKFLSAVDPRQHTLPLRGVEEAPIQFRNLGD
jgi:hypothetical protein